MKRLFGLLVVLSLCLPGLVLGEEARLDFGGDSYVAGQAARVEAAVPRDAFAAGYDVSLKAAVAGDAHLAGYNVGADGAITGNLYAAGSSVSVNAPVGGDVTAFGQSIQLRAPATVGGNLRLAGAIIGLEAPVAGSALVTAQTLTLDTTIAGDLNFFGDSIHFGPTAKVTGRVIIQAPSAIAVPESVASADRVSYTQLVAPDFATEAGKTAEHVVRGFWPAVWATGLWWLLLALVGLLFITLANRFVLDMEAAAVRRPVRNFGLGVLAFATVLGLVPVVALTVVGLVVLPFVIAFVAVAWALAYVAGAYLIGLMIGRALLPIDSNIKRLGVLVAAIVVAGLVGMIPIVGWLVMLVLTIFGFGTFALRTMVRWTAGDATPLQPTAAA
jgi:hypothetical protein